MTAPPRDRATRLADTRRRLERDIDLWLATAPAGGGAPGLVPLSFHWDGATLLVATPSTSRAGTNLRDTGRARAALGGLRDVVIVDAHAEERAMDAVPAARWERYAAHAGWDPRAEGPPYAAYLLTPVQVQAWRESNELPGRTLMRDGSWLSPDRGEDGAPVGSPGFPGGAGTGRAGPQ